jgi:hypothetical protein
MKLSQLNTTRYGMPKNRGKRIEKKEKGLTFSRKPLAIFWLPDLDSNQGPAD